MPVPVVMRPCSSPKQIEKARLPTVDQVYRNPNHTCCHLKLSSKDIYFVLLGSPSCPMLDRRGHHREADEQHAAIKNLLKSADQVRSPAQRGVFGESILPQPSPPSSPLKIHPSHHTLLVYSPTGLLPSACKSRNHLHLYFLPRSLAYLLTQCGVPVICKGAHLLGLENFICTIMIRTAKRDFQVASQSQRKPE